MLDDINYIIKHDPALIPIYLFMIFITGMLIWELLKFILFIIRESGKPSKKSKK